MTISKRGSGGGKIMLRGRKNWPLSLRGHHPHSSARKGPTWLGAKKKRSGEGKERGKEGGGDALGRGKYKVETKDRHSVEPGGKSGKKIGGRG